MRGTIAKEVTTQLHKLETTIESAPELVIAPDGTCRLFTGGRMPAGATKGAFLGALPKTLAAGMPATARLGTGTRTPARRTPTARARPANGRTPTRSRQL